MKIAGIILAAGESSRMGSAKIEAKLGGRTFLEWILQAYRDVGIEKPLVVMRRDSGDFPEDYQILINPQPDRGKLSSLRTAMPFLPEKTAFFMQLVDHPLVKTDTYKKMIGVFDGYRIVIPAFIGRKGHPVLFPAGMKEIIMTTKDEEGLRGAISRWRPGVKLVDTDDEAILWDINTREELARLERRLRADGK